MKSLLKALLVLLLLAFFAGAAYVVFGNMPEEFPAASESARRLQPGPWSVGHLEDTWIDESRRTQPNGDYAGDRRRTLVGDVWYPEELSSPELSDAEEEGDSSTPRPASKFPLLVYSHGFTSNRQNGAYLGEHLASYGFVVVAIDYPLTSMTAPGGPMVEDVVNQPGDVSFLIDTLTAASADPQHVLSGKIDGERIGVVGISLGGLTSTLVGFHPQWKDTRIDAALSIAGPMHVFTREFFAGARTPFLMLAGSVDALVPFESNARPVPGRVPGGELVTVEGGSHTGFSGATRWFRWMHNPDAIGCWAVTRNVDSDFLATGYEILGSADSGIDYTAEDELCKVDPLPETMNVLRQQMIARVVVTAFFERYLSDDPERRRAASRFLERDMESELDEVGYRRSRLPPPPEPTAEDEEATLTDAERRLINLMFDKSVNTNNEAGAGGG